MVGDPTNRGAFTLTAGWEELLRKMFEYFREGRVTDGMNVPLLSVAPPQYLRIMKTLLAVTLIPLALVSCFPKELTGDTYSRNEVGQAQSIRTGTVQNVKFVKIQGEQSAGSAVGAIAGGIIGNQVGQGSGRTLATLGGVAAGAVAGGATEQGINNKQGVELTIKFDDGDTEAFVQQHTEREPFNVGDRVRVLYGSGRIRVSH